jgi:hypothetical protein
MEGGRPRALLRQDLSTSSGRVAQDKLTLQGKVQRANPCGCPVTRPPRLARPPPARSCLAVAGTAIFRVSPSPLVKYPGQRLKVLTI